MEEKNTEEMLRRIEETYRKRADQAQQSLSAVQRSITRISLLRVLLFAAGITGVAVCWPIGAPAVAGVALLAAVPFILLMKRHSRLFRQKSHLEQAVRVNREECDALNHQYETFDDGQEYVNPTHPYTYDLDIFGPKSLFQYMNRTCCTPGKQCLATWLGEQLTEREKIEERQEAVSELSRLLDFRQQFRIAGLLHHGQTNDDQMLREWSRQSPLLRNRRWMRWLPAIVGSCNLMVLLAVATGAIPISFWLMTWSLFALLSTGLTRKINRLQANYGKRLSILKTYLHLMQLIEGLPAESRLLKAIKQRIGSAQGEGSLAIRRLDRLMDGLDQRNNVIIYLLLNGAFFWEVWQIMRIEAWREQHAGQLPQWLAAIGEMDALCSLATFAYNHPDYVYPILSEVCGDEFRFTAQGLGHPLIERQRCVRNDIDMQQRPAFIIITGANMAGKSTYLRTVGVNFLLACIGAPVCAHHMALSPTKLITSLRTTDSLSDQESYFFSELKRLQLIIHRLQSGETLFVILDEILKGTNSVDKQKGSLALARQFMKLQANGIIATHDLQLGTLAHQFPDRIRNFRFEADITGDELTFPYRMQPGIAQNMNACFLMRKMGIAVIDS